MYLLFADCIIKLSWHTVGPILAEKYTVIAPDNRGMGASTLPTDGDYTASTSADDMKAIADFLNINQTFVFSHDKGAGIAAAFAIKYRTLVKRVGLSEYGLPGFGYEQSWAPSPDWTLYSNWQLAFFAVPKAAEFFISGKEKEMLAWYFWHASYQGDEAIPESHLERYTTQLRKPGFLESMLQVFSTGTVAADSKFFTDALTSQPLEQPVLGMGGEASFGPTSLIEQLYSPIATNLQTALIPKAGHWILDENPHEVAEKVIEFFGYDEGIPAVDLSYLAGRATLRK